jgi:hypothetical protein
MIRRYVLDERGEPRPEPDLDIWAHWLGHDERRIVRQQRWTNNDGQQVFVSTVFLGLDHSFGQHGLPVLWETMVFIDEESDKDMRRYVSRAAAIRGHNDLVVHYGGRVLE